VVRQQQNATKATFESKAKQETNKIFVEIYLMGLKDRNKLIPDEYCILALYFYW
jgi:hypothetical protein